MSGEDGDRFAGSLPRQSATEAAALVPADATLAVSGFGSAGYPKGVPLALAESDRDLALSVVSGGSTGPEIDVHLAESGALARRVPYQTREATRERINAGEVAFLDRHIAGLGDDVRFGPHLTPDVAVVEAVAVGPDWLVPSTSIGHTPAYVESADRLVVEVNRAQPLALRRFHDVYTLESPPNREPIPLSSAGERIGSPRVEFDPGKLVAVVETDQPDTPYEFREPTPTDEAIAANLEAFLAAEVDRNPALADHLHLQFGVGNVGNALMRTLQSMSFEDRRVSFFGEVIQDGLLDMLDQGAIDAASATSLAVSERGRDRLFENAERYADRVVVRPADVSNNPDPVSRFGVVGVNSALEVDLYGHANSTHLNGTHLVNGIGGSNDFVRHGLVGILALPSTAAGGDVSRVVPMVPHVDHTEHDISVVVTEQGVADLRSLSPLERASTLVEECAHPSFRDRLRAYLDDAATHGGHVHHDIERALSWHAAWRDGRSLE